MMHSLDKLIRGLILVAAVIVLPGCEDEPEAMVMPAPETPPPMAAEAPAPAPIMLSPALNPATNLPAMEMWAAERIAERFLTLHRLVQDSLLEPRRYDAWMQENEGAFLLLTEPPPVQGLAGKIPPYQDVADYLRRIKQDRADVAAAERGALLDSLMPSSGLRAAAMQPPKGKDFERWVALLDRLAALGALPADKVAVEKQALALIGASAGP